MIKAKVDPEVCIGCGLCIDTCPDFFRMEGVLAVAKDGPVPAELEDGVREAAETCPVEAIVLEE